MGPAEEKSRRFARRIVRLYRYLCTERKEFVLSKQLLRSGTSIGANLAEAHYAFSRNDFLAKVYIALKETSETIYWIDLLYDSNYLSARQHDSLMQDAQELLRILTSSTKTIREQKESE